jgi:hypothetical protein
VTNVSVALHRKKKKTLCRELVKSATYALVKTSQLFWVVHIFKKKCATCVSLYPVLLNPDILLWANLQLRWLVDLHWFRPRKKNLHWWFRSEFWTAVISDQSCHYCGLIPRNQSSISQGSYKEKKTLVLLDQRAFEHRSGLTAQRRAWRAETKHMSSIERLARSVRLNARQDSVWGAARSTN